MLHRLTLRVLPKLNAVVTEPSVRKRKRIVMLLPGLVAFVCYRLLKLVVPLSDPFLLLAVSGLFSSVTSLWAYRMGRGTSLIALFQEDGLRRLGWVIGWVGFVYGVQLSLLVMALLKLFVGYDFLEHPDGPAMMAIIIACTSVTRDAFEIGYVRRLEQQGEALVTFPDGEALRRLVHIQPMVLAQWTFLAAAVGIVVSLTLGLFEGMGKSVVTQVILVSLVSASLAYAAYLIGRFGLSEWVQRAKDRGWLELLRFWSWPCLTFAITYYLVQAGVFAFLVGTNLTDTAVQAFMAGITSSLMVCYCYYLGSRTLVEAQAQQGVPENLRSCPFVMSILTKAGVVPEDRELPQTNIPIGQPEKTR